VAAVHVVSDIILLVGKLAITAMSVGLSALLLNNASPWKSTVSSAFVPCVLIAFLSYFVAWLFFLTFETVIDTTFLCFLVDAENAEKNKGEAMFASKGLQSLVGKYQLRSAQEGAQQKADAAEMYKGAAASRGVQDHQPSAEAAHAVAEPAAAPSSPKAANTTKHHEAWGEK